MISHHHTAARLPMSQAQPRVGSFAHPWAADRGALAVGGVCPVADRKRSSGEFSRGDPAPS